MPDLFEPQVTRCPVVVDAFQLRSNQTIKHYALEPEDIDIMSSQKHAIAILSSRGSQVHACTSPAGVIDIKAQQKTKTRSFAETIEPITIEVVDDRTTYT